MEDVVEVRTNTPTVEVAQQITAAALSARLAASANIHAAIRSAYHWRGGVESVEEVPLVLKTRAGLFDQLAQLVGDLHPYDTPAILGVRADHVSQAYRDWVLRETTPEVSE